MERNKILIIEDDQDLRRGLNLRLRASNYETAFGSDAVMALSIAKKEELDLIPLDLGLPGGDGFLVLERMKNPGNCDRRARPMANEARAMQAGAEAYFQNQLITNSPKQSNVP